MHILWLFFAWPNGGAWSNVAAMPVCGVIAAVLAVTFKDRAGGELEGGADGSS